MIKKYLMMLSCVCDNNQIDYIGIKIKLEKNIFY